MLVSLLTEAGHGLLYVFYLCVIYLCAYSSINVNFIRFTFEHEYKGNVKWFNLTALYKIPSLTRC